MDWILVFLIIGFSGLSETIDSKAETQKENHKRIILKTMVRFIDYCAIGIFVALLYKYYKLA